MERRRRCSSQGREEEEEESVINISHFCANKAKDNPMPCVILDIIAFLLIGFIRIVDGKHSVYRRKKKQIWWHKRRRKFLVRGNDGNESGGTADDSAARPAIKETGELKEVMLSFPAAGCWNRRKAPTADAFDKSLYARRLVWRPYRFVCLDYCRVARFNGWQPVKVTLYSKKHSLHGHLVAEVIAHPPHDSLA